jgi:hypothetical protein
MIEIQFGELHTEANHLRKCLSIDQKLAAAFIVTGAVGVVGGLVTADFTPTILGLISTSFAQIAVRESEKKSEILLGLINKMVNLKTK